MEVDFLSAADGRRLSKSYTFDDTGKLTDEIPFPFTKYLTSFRETINDPESLLEALKRHGDQGHCLLKGLLDRPLNAESRAGHTDAYAQTDWVLLDLDFDEGWESVDAFLYDLAPEWANVTYIWQHSSGAGIKHRAGLRGHLFLLLEQPMHPAVLKRWLTERNFRVTKLNERIQLTATAMGVTYPLDVTTCQNDKLIYIAPPTLHGLDEDPLPERFELVRKARDYAPTIEPSMSTAQLEEQRWRRVRELRKAAGLADVKPKTKEVGTFEVLTNPARAQVTSWKFNNAGYVQLNLNDGDSWGYYFPAEDPTYLFNFKGEPVVRLRDIDPDFYYEYLRARKRAVQGQVVPYVFREPVSDTYYQLLYNEDNDRIDLLQPISSKDKMKDFLDQYGYPLPQPVPDWSLEYRPDTTQAIDPSLQWANEFQPSTYLQKAESGELPNTSEIPPTIRQVLECMTAYDEEVIEHFLNWCACLFQYRSQLQTAWVFHGTTGTGKGTFINYILTPLIGSMHVTQQEGERFDDKFNQDLKSTSLLWLDEMQVSSLPNAETVMQRLKVYITEPKFQLRAMFRNRIEVPNWMNLIITSNYPDPVILEADNRRFNVAPASQYKLKLTDTQIAENIPNELERFAGYLWHREADLSRARSILHTEAERRMQVASQTAERRFFDALIQGDLDYFFEMLRDHPPTHKIMLYQQYVQIFQDWADKALRFGPEYNGRAIFYPVTSTQISVALQYITDVPTPPGKVSRRLNLYKLELERMNDFTGQPTKAIPIQWRVQDEELIRNWLATCNQNGLQAIDGGKND